MEGPATAQASVECRLVVRAHARPDGGPLSHRLWVTAENVGDAPVELTLPDRCPDGPVDFRGLAEGYDYYGTCSAGACPGPREPKRMSLPPGASEELASTTVHLRGAPPCTEGLAEGRHRIVPVVPDLGVPTCVVGTVLEVPARVARRPAPRTEPTPPRPAPERESPAPTDKDERKRQEARGDPYACQQHSDCVLSCPDAPGCCGWPCGCRHAIHEDHRAAFEARYPDTCDKPPCPAVGCAYQPAFGAMCRNGRCVGVRHPGGF
ncbi:MAG: hypothetical protein ACODAU_08225 [Myxococcota bacterium]